MFINYISIKLEKIIQLRKKWIYKNPNAYDYYT